MKKRNTNYIDIDINKLKKLYVDEGYTISYLADYVFFCSHPTLLNRMKEHGIKRDVPEGKRAGYINIDIEHLKDLYYNQKKSMHYIANIYNCSWAVILKRMKEHNLERRNKADHIRRKI
jgi:DNA-binding Lrp family transcriptional regulator